MHVWPTVAPVLIVPYCPMLYCAAIQFEQQRAAGSIAGSLDIICWCSQLMSADWDICQLVAGRVSTFGGICLYTAGWFAATAEPPLT